MLQTKEEVREAGVVYPSLFPSPFVKQNFLKSCYLKKILKQRPGNPSANISAYETVLISKVVNLSGSRARIYKYILK